MALETATYLSELNASNPGHTDTLGQADSHIRLIKSALLATFADLEGATDVTSDALDALQVAYAAGRAWVPVGTIISTLKATTPDGGWLPLTGGTYAYNDYPRLGAYMGSTPGNNFTLPNVEDTGRFLRSKTASLTVGTTQASQNKTHTHTGSVSVSGTTGTESVGHTHTFSGTTGGQSADHTHGYAVFNGSNSTSAGPNPPGGSNGAGTTGTTSNDHTHTFSGTTSGENVPHTHAVSASGSFTTAADGGTEARPESLVVAMWIKT